PQLRDLVNMWIGEKTQARELGDRLESMRGEIDGLLVGMQRSAQELERLRADALSPLGVQIAGLWNVMVERVRTATVAAQEGAPAAGADDSDSDQAAALQVRALVSRLDELESELERLRTRVHEPIVGLENELAPTSGAARQHAGRAPLLVPE